jgi:transcriptional antiterminator RfaH
MIMHSPPNWYAVQAQPRSEMKASSHLARQGFEVFLPRFLKRRRHARRVENISSPLFPGYLFVAIDMATQRWRCINSTVGVQRLVCIGNAPAIVERKTIEALKGRQDECGFIKLEKPRFMAGEKVRVIDGVFSDSLGIYEGMTDRQRVEILLELLGRKVRVHIDIDSVAAA